MIGVIVLILLLLVAVAIIVPLVLLLGDDDDNKETLIISFDSRMTLENETWTDAYNNPSSDGYQQLTGQFCDNIKDSFMKSNVSDRYDDCRVDNLSPGSVIVQFTIDMKLSVEKQDNNTESAIIARSQSTIDQLITLVQAVVEKLAADTPGYTNPYVTDNPIVYLVTDNGNSNATTTTQVPTTLFPETCGGTLVATSTGQQVASPGFTSGRYSNDLTCTWTISAPSGIPVFLSFHTFQLEPTYRGECVDSVTIQEGSTDVITLGFYCGSLDTPGWNGFDSVISNTSTVTVIFKTDESVVDVGFLANYKIGIDGAECASNPCQNGGTCTEGDLSYTCSCPTNYYGSHCQETDTCAIGGECTGSHESCVDFECVCDENWADEECDTYILCDPSGIELTASSTWQAIGSPNFPGLYPNDANCKWSIRAPLTSDNIVLKFSKFQLEGGFEGCYDYLSITNGLDNSQIGQLCGSVEPDAILTNTFNLEVEFVSDYSFPYTGFQMYYKTAVDYCADNPCESFEECFNGIDTYECKCPDGTSGSSCSVINTCGGSLQAEATSKQFATPNYPSNYSNSQICTWVITAASGKGIRITLDEVSLEKPCYDTVKIYEGSTASGDSVTDVCGTSSLGDHTSTTNSMTVVFQSDYSISETGALGSYIELTDGNECDSNPCQNLGTCIEELFSYTCNCTGNYVGPNCEVEDGFSCNSNPCASGATCVEGTLEYFCECPSGKAGVNCEDDDPCLNEPCQNGGTCDLVTLESGLSFTCKCALGYAGEFCQVSTACGGDLTIDENTTLYIATPGFGDTGYPNNADCTWAITGLPNSFIIAKFEYFSLEDGCFDRIMFTNGNNGDSVTICPGIREDYIPEEVITGDRMLIQFTSDESITAAGAILRIELDEDDCDGKDCGSGQCVDGLRSFTCSCDCCSIGEFCNEVDHCASDPCVNGACVNQGNGYICNCDSGYIGTNCENPNPDCDGNLCVNGACLEGTTGTLNYVCSCDAGWTGTYCNESNCGTKTFATSQRIVSGKEADENDWPWQAVILKDNPKFYDGTTMDDFNYCGGTLISDQHIITAAHCEVKVGDFVALGAHDLTKPCTDHCVIVEVDAVTNHQGYDDVTTDNDLAILKLKNSVSFSNEVSPICVPATTDAFTQGSALTITGWGDTERRLINEIGAEPNLPDTLQEAEMKLIGDATCEKLLGIQNNIFTANMICAGDLSDTTPPDSCQGDSGGPAQAEINGKWTLVGVTSWGNGCGDPNSPGVYTKVSRYISWIEANK